MTDYALIIGIDHYKDGSLSRLGGAINDASDFKDWVTDSKGGNVDDSNCAYLTSDEGLTKLVLDQIEDAFEVIYKKAKNQRADSRRFYFFFSGHGFGIDLDSASLALTNWTKTLANRGISSRKFHKVLRESGVFEETMFFLDCCRSTKVNVEGQTPGLWIPGIHTNAKDVKSFTAFATKFTDVAIEAEIEGRRNGYFTKALLEGLNGHAGEPNGDVTRSGLEGYLAIRTKELSEKENWYQDVVVSNKKFAPDDVLVKADNTDLVEDDGTEKALKVIIHFTDEMTGKYDLLDKDANVVGTWEDGEKEWEVHLRPGLNLLKRKEPFQILDFRVVKTTNSEQHVRFE